MSKKVAKVIDADYYVVEFIEQPYMGIERFVCVPQAWVYDSGDTGGITVAYPRKRISNVIFYLNWNEEPQRHWQYYRANLIFGADEITDALRYIRNKSNMEATKGRHCNSQSKGGGSSIYKLKKKQTLDPKELKVIVQRIPATKRNLKRPILDNTKSNVTKKRVTEIKTEKFNKTPSSIKSETLNKKKPDELQNFNINVTINYVDKTEQQNNATNNVTTDLSNQSPQQQIHFSIDYPVKDFGNKPINKEQPNVNIKEDQLKDSNKTYNSIITINKPFNKYINQSHQVLEHSDNSIPHIPNQPLIHDKYYLPSKHLDKQRPPVRINESCSHNTTVKSNLELNSTNEANWRPSNVKEMTNSVHNCPRESPSTSTRMNYESHEKSILKAKEPYLFQDHHQTNKYVQQYLHCNDKTQLNCFENSTKPLQCNRNGFNQCCETVSHMQNNTNLPINKNYVNLGPSAEKTWGIPTGNHIAPNSSNSSNLSFQSTASQEKQVTPMYINQQIQNIYEHTTLSELNNAANMYHRNNLKNTNLVMSNPVEDFSKPDQVIMSIKSKLNKPINLGVPRTNNIPSSEHPSVAMNYLVPFLDPESRKEEFCRNYNRHSVPKITAKETHDLNYRDRRVFLQQGDMRKPETCKNYLNHASNISFTQKTVNAEAYPVYGLHKTPHGGLQVLNPENRRRQLPVTLNLNQYPLDYEKYRLPNSLVAEAFSKNNINESSQRTCIQGIASPRIYSPKKYVVDDRPKVIIAKNHKANPSNKRNYFPNNNNNTVAGNNYYKVIKHTDQIPKILNNNDLSPGYLQNFHQNLPTQNIIAAESNHEYSLNERDSLQSTGMRSPHISTNRVAHDKDNNFLKTCNKWSYTVVGNDYSMAMKHSIEIPKILSNNDLSPGYLPNSYQKPPTHNIIAAETNAEYSFNDSLQSTGMRSPRISANRVAHDNDNNVLKTCSNWNNTVVGNNYSMPMKHSIQLPKILNNNDLTPVYLPNFYQNLPTQNIIAAETKDKYSFNDRDSLQSTGMRSPRIPANTVAHDKDNNVLKAYNNWSNTVGGNNYPMAMKHSNQIPEIIRNYAFSPGYVQNLYQNLPPQNIIAAETNAEYSLSERASVQSTGMRSLNISTNRVEHDKDNNVLKTYNNWSNTVVGNNYSMAMKHSNEISEILCNYAFSPGYVQNLHQNLPRQNTVVADRNDKHNLNEITSIQSISMKSPNISTDRVVQDKDNDSKILPLEEVMNCALTSAMNNRPCNNNKTPITTKSNQVLDQRAPISEDSLIKNLLLKEVNYESLSSNNINCDNKKYDNHIETPPATSKDTTLLDVKLLKTFANELNNKTYDYSNKHNNSNGFTSETKEAINVDKLIKASKLKQNNQSAEIKSNNSEDSCESIGKNAQYVSIIKSFQSFDNSDPDNVLFIDDTDGNKTTHIDNMFRLPLECIPHSSQYTLNYQTASKLQIQIGICELLPKTRIYDNEVRLKHCLTKAYDYNKLARRLLLEIFSLNAITICTFCDIKQNFEDNCNVDKLVLTLDQNAKETILEWVKGHGRVNIRDQMNVTAVSYHSGNPRAIKGLSKSTPPVIWESNENSWITMKIFQNYFTEYICSCVNRYWEIKKLETISLPLFDDSPSHQTNVSDLITRARNKEVFLPPNSTTLIQPMKQGVISKVKVYYLRRIFRQMFEKTDGYEKRSIREFWKNYNIVKAVENTKFSWNEVTEKCLKRKEKNIWPDLRKSGESGHSVFINETVELENQTSLDEVNMEEVEEIVQETAATFSNHELKELADEEEQKDIGSSVCEEEQKELSAEFLKASLSTITAIMDQFIENDPNFNRSSKARQYVINALSTYQELLTERKRKSQITLDTFLTKRQKIENTENTE